ncbi:MAG: hypothetical protein Kow0031_21630 [Anaerolineae bacterium]
MTSGNHKRSNNNKLLFYQQKPGVIFRKFVLAFPLPPGVTGFAKTFGYGIIHL